MSENIGQGSSGSWREEDADTTKHGVPGWGESGAEGTKISAFETKQRRHVHHQPIGVRARKRQAAEARRNVGLKPMRFVSLHHHSTYSFLDGVQLPEAHVRRAGEVNMSALAMTEHGNIFSHVQLEKAAVSAGIKPIFGCEFYVGWTDDRRAQKKNHITVIAKNEEGYRNLLQLTTKSWKEGFYHDPTVDWRWLAKFQRGLVILSGCQGGALFTALVGGKFVPEEEASYERGLKVARWMSARFDDFYIEVQAFPELEKTCQANPMLARIAKEIRRPLVATMDCHYTAPEEAELQAILHNVRPGEKQTLEEQVRGWGYEVPLCAPPTDKAIYRRLRATGLTKEEAVEAIVSTEEIAQECTVVLPKLPQVEFPLPDGYDDHTELWRDWLREGWRYRGCHELPKKERRRYREQLAREMEVIEAKGYVNYFLIVADAIQYAKEEQIPIGPARGSAAASLACYLLRITEIDPMLYPILVFERFIDWSRQDMPDIDIDFATYGRSIVRDYLVKKYGEGNVNNVGTFQAYKSKNSLDDAARVHNVPGSEVAKIKDVLIERSSGDLRASATIEDTVGQFDSAYEVLEKFPDLRTAMDLEGNYKAFGIHAAGLVISREPPDKAGVAALLWREVPKGSGNWITAISLDKYDAERQGMEKLDFLALSTMDMIAEAMHHLDMSVEELYAIPTDDQKTIDGFTRNDVIGIFQFDGRATRYVNGVVKPNFFEEIALIVALSRPGPLHNGAVQGYNAVKFGGEEPEWIHESLKPITEFTNGQIIFQEQIMRIVREVGGFDWEGVGKIRKVIALKKGEQEFNRSWEEFRAGAMTVHERMDVPAMDETTAKRIWGMMTTAGAYAFNAAHTISYGLISYWSMYLKQHEPQAYYAASLAKLKKDEKLIALRRDAVRGSGPRKPIEVLPPSLDSEATWIPEGDRAVRAGWQQLPGIGEKTAPIIAEAGPYESYDDLLKVKGIGPKTVETVREFCEGRDPFGIKKLDEAIETVTEALEEGIEGDDGKPLPVPTHTASELADAEPGSTVVVLAQPHDRNLRDIHEVNRAKGEELDPKTKRLDLSQWCVFTLRDADGQCSFIVSRFKWPTFKDVVMRIRLNANELVLFEARKGDKRGGREDRGSDIVFLDRLWVLEPEED